MDNDVADVETHRVELLEYASMWKINGEKGRGKNCVTAEIQVEKKERGEKRSQRKFITKLIFLHAHFQT